MSFIIMSPMRNALRNEFDLSHTPAFKSIFQMTNIQSFEIELQNKQLTILYSNKILLSSISTIPFLRISKTNLDFYDGYGSFPITEKIQDISVDWTVDFIDLDKRDEMSFRGFVLFRDGDQCEYSFTFYLASPRQLGFTIQLLNTKVSSYNMLLTYKSDPQEAFYGCGEQLGRLNLKGHCIPILVREDGIGRGLQPLTFCTNKLFGKNAGGDLSCSYKPVPHYISSNMNSLFLETKCFSKFDFRQKDLVILTIDSCHVSGRILYGTTPKELIQEYTEYSGRMSVLPEWTQNGIIVGIQGGSEKVLSIIDKSIKSNVPISGVWLQDWCGSRDQSILGQTLKRLWWNWEPDTLLYPEWNIFVSNLRNRNIHVLSYINPFLMDVQKGAKSKYKRNMYLEAFKRGFLVRNEHNQVLSISSGPRIEAGVLDLYNEKAVEWMESEFITHFESGVSGYMADFGEFLPPGSINHTGVSTTSQHNEYAEKWAQLQKNVLSSISLDGKASSVDNKKMNKIIFHRSGFTQSPGLANLFWAGDQLVSWDKYDGIKAGLMGLMCSGMSGFSLNHMDVGGYSTFAFNVFGTVFGYYRSKELLFRWMELGVFGCIYRSHEGSMPDVNAQFYSDQFSLNHIAYCGSMYTSLKEYRKELMLEAFKFGYPLIRTMFFEFPNDNQGWNLSSQFMFGDSLLVCPVLDPLETTVSVYLPSIGESWVHVWTGKVYDYGWVSVPAPIGQPGIFVKWTDYHKRKSLVEFIQFCQCQSYHSEEFTIQSIKDFMEMICFWLSIFIQEILDSFVFILNYMNYI